MPSLSRNCELSTVYTNHSIRVTGATVLSQENFAPNQIMSVTGHKSVSFLAIYQRVSNKEKLEMGQTLTRALTNPMAQTVENLPQKENPETAEDLPQTKDLEALHSAVVPTTQATCSDPFAELIDFPDFDIGTIMSSQTSTVATGDIMAQSKVTTTVQKSSPRIPNFINCRIQNVNLYFK